jgi:hypothetical protein
MMVIGNTELLIARVKSGQPCGRTGGRGIHVADELTCSSESLSHLRSLNCSERAKASIASSADKHLHVGYSLRLWPNLEKFEGNG